MFRNFFLINVILLTVVGLLGYKFYKVWSIPLDVPGQASQQKFQTDKERLVNRKEVKLDKAVYSVIVRKDLFRPSRSAAPETKASKPLSPKEAPKLFGTMIMNNDNVAILEDKFTKTTKLYHVNDSISGYVISEIQKDKVILKKAGQSIEVKLRDTKGFRSPSSSPSQSLIPAQKTEQRRRMRPRSRRQKFYDQKARN